MKLRGRFTFALALAALVPIVVAAGVTVKVIGDSYDRGYEQRKATAEASVESQIDGLLARVDKADEVLADHTHSLTGGLLLDLAKRTAPGITYDMGVLCSEQGPKWMQGLQLDVLTITDASDRVLCAPHAPGEIGESNHPEVRTRAHAARAGQTATGKTIGRAFFVREDITRSVDAKTISELVLVAEASRIARADVHEIAVAAGRRVAEDLLVGVRTGRDSDARVVMTDGTVLIPPIDADWAQLSQDAPRRVDLLGPDGKPVARVEIAVSDAEVRRLKRDILLISLALAAIALVGVVLIGLLVARRTARDLDQLVAGSLAAARGDLDHRVPVRSEDEIGAVAASFNFMMEDLKTSKERLVIAERIAAWQEIARRLAHEIKNPLTPIQMAMDTLRKTWKKQHPSFGEILEESTTTVMEEADRLKKIVSEFSGFARMPKPEFHRIDLNEVVRSALALYQGAAPIDIKLFPALPHIDADKNQLNQVVLNLVENARDAIGQRSEGRITVSSRLGDAGDRAMLIVEDNGPGIPVDLKDKVFAPYFTTKLSKGGTGLGLAIVHRIVSDHGGRIAVADVPGGGARFAIELPLRNGTALLTSRI
jgi:two-component system nitrogen regulation sensor histidine kinase NtrY